MWPQLKKRTTIVWTTGRLQLDSRRTRGARKSLLLRNQRQPRRFWTKQKPRTWSIRLITNPLNHPRCRVRGQHFSFHLFNKSTKNYILLIYLTKCLYLVNLSIIVGLTSPMIFNSDRCNAASVKLRERYVLGVADDSAVDGNSSVGDEHLADIESGEY